MKTKIIIVVAVAVCVGLFIGLLAVKNQGDSRHSKDLSTIAEFSNQLDQASAKIIELKDVNIAWSNDLARSQHDVAELSNSLATASAALTDTQGSLASAETLITNLNTRIADLEVQNKTLDQRATELTADLARLNDQIAETKARLARSEGDNAYLQAELQKQLAAKAELEHKFNDLDALRAQVKKIKNDLFVARRLELMKNDNTGKKGAEILTTRSQPATAADNAPAGSLNVEIGTDGSVRVIPPLGTTNSAAQ